MDHRLRDSERRAAIGDDQARSTLLRERVRAGELTASDLELAAYVGDVAAIAATSAAPKELEFEAWIEGLGRWGLPVLIRAGVALGRALLEERRVLPGRPEPAALTALDEAAAWCDDPVRPLWWILENAKNAAFVSAEGIDKTIAWLATELIAGAGSELPEAAAHVVEASQLALRVINEPAARAVVRDALLQRIYAA